ncbi:hypothetical protein BMS3Abin17_00218 [archaeon BMS3Abin17]|nr:hypothetical protein BMS3Abin17_00218 [archaeon BMS3Abin17]
MKDPLNIGIGTFFIILGLYLMNKFQDSISVIGGIFCISIGIGIIAKK